jgi:hypothetical protein
MNKRIVYVFFIVLLSTLSPSFIQNSSYFLEGSHATFKSGNTIDCGTNASNLSFEVYADQDEWNQNDTLTMHLDTYCGMWNQTYVVNWTLTHNDLSYEYTSGNSTFNINGNTVEYQQGQSDHINSIDLIEYYIPSGNYTLYGQLLETSSGASVGEMEHSFFVSQNQSTTSCGYNSELISTTIRRYNTQIYVNDSIHIDVDTECPEFHKTYTLLWEFFDNNVSSIYDSGSFEFTPDQTNVNFSSDGSEFYYRSNISLYNLPEGYHDFNIELVVMNETTTNWDNVLLDHDPVPVSGCGTNQSYTTLYSAYPVISNDQTEPVEARFILFCGLLGYENVLDYELHNSATQQLISSGQITWTGTNYSDIRFVSLGQLSAGEYLLSGTFGYYKFDTVLITVDNGAWNFTMHSVNQTGVIAISDENQSSMLNLQNEHDNDGDGIGNDVDTDNDNDCILDIYDSNPFDFDNDGIDDYQDIDDDGDGLNDTDEVTDSDPLTNIYDADNDGYHDCNFVASSGNSTNNNGNQNEGNNTEGNTTESSGNSSTQLNCSMLSESSYDGMIMLYNISNQYVSGDSVHAFIDVCWKPSNQSMWYEVWLNHTNTGDVVQSWWAQGTGTFPAYWQAIQHEPGHTSFPMRDLYPTSGAWNLQIDTLTYDGEYCFEARLKVFDNTYGAFFVVDHDGPVCFMIEGTNTGENIDNDNDGWNNGDENQCGTNPNDSSSIPADFDGDGECDEIDADDDGDGVDDVVDSCPETASGEVVDQYGCEILLCPNGQIDCNGNCVDTSTDIANCGACGNACPDGASCESGLCVTPEVEETDSDDDGIPDADDNCPGMPNIDQADGDGDGIGTACDQSEMLTSIDGEEDGSSSSVPSLSMVATLMMVLAALFVTKARRKFE